MNKDHRPKSTALIVGIVALLSVSLVAWQTITPEPPAAPAEPAPVEGLAIPPIPAPPPLPDTVPSRNHKVRDIDEAIEQLDRIDLQKEMINAQQQALRAVQEIDFEKMGADIEKAMASLDKQKIQMQIQEAMQKIDFDKLKLELAELSDKQKEEIRLSMKKAQEEMERIGPKLEKELAKAREELEKQQPKMKEEMRRAKEEVEKMGPKLQEELEKAKVDIEKAKKDLQEYKSFIDGLDADGLINKKNGYRIDYKDGELKINGELIPAVKYKKYNSFLEKHPTLEITKDEDGFNIRDKDSHEKE